jgi:hypothetical protein
MKEDQFKSKLFAKFKKGEFQLCQVQGELEILQTLGYFRQHVFLDGERRLQSSDSVDCWK